MNEAAISSAVLCEAVHYGIVTKRVYKDIAFLREASVGQIVHSPMVVWQSRYSMDDVVGSFVQPFTIVNKTQDRVEGISRSSFIVRFYCHRLLIVPSLPL